MNGWRQNRIIRRCAAFFAAFLVTAACFAKTGFEAYAAPLWGQPEELEAGAAIVMDADTGAILYGKNIHKQCFPASITKLMTALLVIENCDLDEMVTFSESAVTGLEAGAVTAYTSAGDQLTVRDCLYALLFRSANDVANALAEHVSGSVDAFAKRMNERAKELGCLNTNFRNPSGLSDTAHLTTSYDMALIASACMQSRTFLEIESADSYKIGPTAKRPNGLTVTIGHKMKRSGTDYTDSRVIGGKTGFTSASGNTLVTMAEDGGRRLAAVVMQDRNPAHYTDTKKLLDFGFDGFENLDASGLCSVKELEERLLLDRVIEEGENDVKTDRAFLATMPKGTDAAALPSLLQVDYEYNLDGGAPDNAVAALLLKYGDHTAGRYYVCNDRESKLSIVDMPTETKVALGVSLTAVLGIGAFFFLGGGTAVWHVHNVRVEQNRLAEAKNRRRRRLESMHVSEEEFDALMQQYKERRRSAGQAARQGRAGRAAVRRTDRRRRTHSRT